MTPFPQHYTNLCEKTIVMEQPFDFYGGRVLEKLHWKQTIVHEICAMNKLFWCGRNKPFFLIIDVTEKA